MVMCNHIKWWKNTYPHRTWNKAINFFCICLTCHRQLIKKPMVLKRNLKSQGFIIPKSKDELITLSATEKRIISLVQPFGRIYNKAGRQGLNGTTKFVSLEPQRFQEDIYGKLLNQKSYYLEEFGVTRRYPA